MSGDAETREYKLYVGGLSYGVDDNLLWDTFKVHGEIPFSRVCSDRETGTSRGFGFVCYSTLEAADAAVVKSGGMQTTWKRAAAQGARATATRTPPHCRAS